MCFDAVDQLHRHISCLQCYKIIRSDLTDFHTTSTAPISTTKLQTRILVPVVCSVDAAVVALCIACVTVCSAPPGGDDADVPSWDQLFYSHANTHNSKNKRSRA